MMKNGGLFIVIEGSDGSGKTTQLNLLAERLKAVGHEVDVYDFPRYEEPSSYFVRRYLNGEYGPASEVSPYTTSLFYALDRYETAPQLRQSLADGKIVLADRYTASNMAHQGAKFSNSGEQRGFFMWDDSLEYELLGIPRPNLTIFLRVPADDSDGLINQRGQKKHQHEDDIEHLRAAVSAYDNLCKLFPKEFKAIECMKRGKIRPITDINNEVWEILKPYLPQPTLKAKPTVVNLSEGTTSNRLSVPAAKSDRSESLVLNDISLLAINALQSAALPKIRYEYRWPPNASQPRLSYYIPSQFSPKLSKRYISVMEKLADLYKQMQKSIELASKKPAHKDAAKARKLIEAATPMSMLVNAQIIGSDAVDSLINRSRLSKLPELNFLAKNTARQRDNEPEDLKNIIRQLAESRLPLGRSDDETVKLLDFWPRNEFDLLIESLFLHSNLQREDIANELDKWKYERKAKALKAAFVQHADLLLEKARYRFDIISDRSTITDIADWLQPSELELQMPTPRHGYDVPEDFEQIGIEEQFIECFDMSLELFSEIQAAGHEYLASYASLVGHRLHCQMSVSGSSLFKKYPIQNRYSAQLLALLREKAAEAHPLAADHLPKILETRRQKNRSSRKTIGPKKHQRQQK